MLSSSCWSFRSTQNNAGKTTPDTTVADVLLLHPETRHYARTHASLGEFTGRIVSPHWIEDCVLYRRKLPLVNPFYAVPLPDPEDVQRQAGGRKIVVRRPGNQGCAGSFELPHSSLR